MNTCVFIRLAIGRAMDNPGRSCKGIADKSSNPLGDGEYWITPEVSKKPFIVYCDMKTDGGNSATILSYFLFSFPVVGI